MASYYVWSGATGSANGTSWANAYTKLATAFTGKAASDIFYVAHDHAETTAGTVALTNPLTSNVAPTRIICANRAGSVPPVSADRRATATVASTGVGDISFTGYTHYDGIIFNCAAGSSGSLILGSTDFSRLRFDNCSLRAAGTSTNAIGIGTSAAEGVFVELNNTTLSFATVGGICNPQGTLKWRNTPSALLGTIPTFLFQPVAGRGCNVECIGVDLSAAGSGKTIVDAATVNQTISCVFRFIDCKLNASVTKSGQPQTAGALECDFIRSGATGVNYQLTSYRRTGTLDHETTIVRSGGASDGTTPISWKVVTPANCDYSMSFECPPIAIWNDTTGSAKTATVECIAAAIMTDADIWLDVEYLGDASSPQGSFVNDGKADLLATAANQTTSSASWGGSTTPFKLAATFTAQQKGWIYCRVKCGKPSSTFYIDPMVTLT